MKMGFFPHSLQNEEYVVDCDHQNYGCAGGYLAYVWQFLSIGGTVPDSCVPYASGEKEMGKREKGKKEREKEERERERVCVCVCECVMRERGVCKGNGRGRD